MWDAEPYTLDLSDVIRLSDDDLMKICEANPDLEIEQDAAGQLEIMAPAGLKSNALETRFVGALWEWNNERNGGVVFSGTAGFRLPNGAMRAPDASWVRRETWDAISPDEQESFARLVPEFLVEVRSRSNALAALQRKMREWIENGCLLAWLVDPIERRAHIYSSDGTIEEKDFDGVLSGEDVLPGFEFDLTELE